MHKLILPALFSLLATALEAAPVLKAEVSINRPIVTVGDMFDDAGLLAERGLFRAPAPGTTGIVSLEAVRAAAAKRRARRLQPGQCAQRPRRTAGDRGRCDRRSPASSRPSSPSARRDAARRRARRPLRCRHQLQGRGGRGPGNAASASPTSPARRCSRPAFRSRASSCRLMSAAGSTSWSRRRTSAPRCRPAPSSPRPMSR